MDDKRMKSRCFKRGRSVLVIVLTAVLGLSGCATTATKDGIGSDTTEVISQARAASRGGDHDAAIYLYATALETQPDDVTLLQELASSYETSNRLEAAIRAYERVIEIQPDHVDAFERSGLLLLRVGEHEQASARLFKTIGFDDDRWRAHDALGILFDLNGDHHKAVVHYSRALELEPNASAVWNNRGYSLHLAGDYQSAERDFVRALALGAGDRTARNLAMSLAYQGSYERALAALERFDEADSLNEVGAVAMVQGELNVAESLFLRAIDLRPSFFEVADKNLKRVRRLLRQQGVSSESG